MAISAFDLANELGLQPKQEEKKSAIEIMQELNIEPKNQQAINNYNKQFAKQEAPEPKRGFFDKFASFSENTFGKAADFLYGTTGKTVGSLITSGIGSGLALTNDPKLKEIGENLERQVEEDPVTKKDIAFTLLEAYPGGGKLGSLLTKLPGGRFIANKIDGAMKFLPERMQRRAVRMYTEALNPTTKQTKRQAERVVPEMVDRGITGNLESIQKTAAETSNIVGGQIDDLISNLPKNKVENVKPILNEIQNFKAQFIVNGTVVEPQAVKVADDLAQTIVELGDDVSTESLISLRRIWDKQVAKRKGFEKGLDEITSFNLEAKKAATNAIRKELSKSNPTLASLNKEYSFWTTVDDITSATLERTAGQSGKLRQRLGAILGGTVGATSGIPGAIVGAEIGNLAIKLANSAKWKTWSAVKRNKFAEKLIDGDLTSVLFMLKEAGVVTNNQINEILND